MSVPCTPAPAPGREGAAPRAGIAPGATLGVFGGGQLGRMFAMAAARMGYRVIVYAPEPECPAGQIAHEHIHAPYEDQDTVRRFAQRCAAVTIEFENIPPETLELAQSITPTRPGPRALAVAQHRLRERAFLREHGLPAAPHREARSAEQVARAADELGTPFVIKCAQFGYDGRGQMRIDDPRQAPDAWRDLGAGPALCEAWVDFRMEISVIVARSPSGEVRTFGPIQNEHVNHVLDCSLFPADLDARTAEAAADLARRVARALQLEGLICVEMFVTHDEALLVNEIAPRPHNSGHLTIDACSAGQFEQQVRAMCDLPLAAMTAHRPAAMLNLLGDLWRDGPPRWSALLDRPDTVLHLYGKDQARPGRKMGHVTVIAESVEEARSRAGDARDQLLEPPARARERRSPTHKNPTSVDA